MTNQIATSTSKPPREIVTLPVGLTVFCAVLLAIVLIGFQINNWLADEQQMPIQKIVFTGNINEVDEDDLEKKIRRQFNQSFFAVDVNQVHQMIEQQPWVYSASIRKRWPSSLFIHIVEQQAVAIWNGDLLINKYGETFDGLHEGIDLPQLYGPNGSEKTALVGYNHMRLLLKNSQQKINEMFLSERFAWRLKLDNNIVLNLGRQEYINRLQRYIDFYADIAAQNKPIDYVDLRYDTGMAVGWLTTAK